MMDHLNNLPRKKYIALITTIYFATPVPGGGTVLVSAIRYAQRAYNRERGASTLDIP